MPYRKVTRYLSAADGTRIAYHTHLPPDLDESDVDQLAERPTVLLTNGIGTTENFWRFLVEALLPEHRVVHWDYRGHGDSDVAAGGDYSVVTQADDLMRVTEAVVASAHEPEPPLQVAFSMGVTVLLEVYRQRPDLVPAMALLSGAAGVPWGNTAALKIPGALTAVRAALNAATPLVPLAAPLVKRVLASPIIYPAGRALGLLRKRAPREDIDQFMQGLCAMDARAYWDTLRALMYSRGAEVLPSVKVPVLVVAAENDVLVPRVEMEKIRDTIPHARFFVMDDAGHGGLLEAGEEVAAALTAFAREVARRDEGSTSVH